MKAVVLLVLVLAVGALATDTEKRRRLRELCRREEVEVAGGQCCPKSAPVLIGDQCYPHCEDGSDDMVLGTFVGCRAQCEPGASSTLSVCYRGPLHTDRADHSRSGVLPTVQKKIAPTTPVTEVEAKYLPRFCKHGWITVSRRRDKSGGCCPTDAPMLINERCYATCEQGFDDIEVGHFVGCRKQCPDGYDTTTNNCHKSGEEDFERADFPREGVEPLDRRRRGRPPVSKNPKVTCSAGYVAVENSDSLCCPWDHPELIGALCYEECPPAFVGTGFGCRHACPKKAGWVTYPLTCTNWRKKPAKTILRKGWERKPVTPKQAVSVNKNPTPPTDGTTTSP